MLSLAALLAASAASAEDWNRSYVPPVPPPIVLTYTEFRFPSTPSSYSSPSWTPSYPSSYPTPYRPEAAPKPPEPSVYEAMRAGCDEGLANNCLFVGEMLLRWGSYDRGKLDIEKSCELGLAEGCLKVWTLDTRQNAAYAARACELGSGVGCLFDGDARRGADPAGARAAWTKSCDKGIATGCHRLGVDAGEPAKAKPWLQKACTLAEGGAEAASCLDLGDALSTLGEAEGAYAAWDRACKGAEGSVLATACSRVGYARYSGQGTPKDPRAALVALEKSCSTVKGEACWRAAGIADEVGNSSAATLLGSGCQGGVVQACVSLGDRYYSLREPSLFDEAALAYAAGCRLGDVTSCAYGGHLRVFVLHKPAEALQEDLAMLRSACAGGFTPSCTAQGRAHLARVSRDPREAAAETALALEGYRAGCPADPAACGPLGSLLANHDEAVAAWRTGCGVGDAASCWSLGRDAGDRALVVRACELRSGDACASLAAVATGDEAAAWRRKACDAGHGPSCAGESGRMPALPVGTLVRIREGDRLGAYCQAVTLLAPREGMTWNGTVDCKGKRLRGDLVLLPLVIPPRMAVRIVAAEGQPAGAVCTTIEGVPDGEGLHLSAWCPDGDFAVRSAIVDWLPGEEGPIPAKMPRIRAGATVSVRQAVPTEATLHASPPYEPFPGVAWYRGWDLQQKWGQCIADEDLTFEAPGWYRGRVTCKGYGGELTFEQSLVSTIRRR